MQDGGVIPDSGFPRDGGMANEVRAKTSRTRCKHKHLIQHMLSVHGVISGLYLRSVRFRGGSSRCDVEEVVVHGVIVEVVVQIGRAHV